MFLLRTVLSWTYSVKFQLEVLVSTSRFIHCRITDCRKHIMVTDLYLWLSTTESPKELSRLIFPNLLSIDLAHHSEKLSAHGRKLDSILKI